MKIKKKIEKNYAILVLENKPNEDVFLCKTNNEILADEIIRIIETSTDLKIYKKEAIKDFLYSNDFNFIYDMLHHIHMIIQQFQLEGIYFEIYPLVDFTKTVYNKSYPWIQLTPLILKTASDIIINIYNNRHIKEEDAIVHAKNTLFYNIGFLSILNIDKKENRDNITIEISRKNEIYHVDLVSSIKKPIPLFATNIKTLAYDFRDNIMTGDSLKESDDKILYIQSQLEGMILTIKECLRGLNILGVYIHSYSNELTYTYDTNDKERFLNIPSYIETLNILFSELFEDDILVIKEKFRILEEITESKIDINNLN